MVFHGEDGAFVLFIHNFTLAASELEDKPSFVSSRRVVVVIVLANPCFLCWCQSLAFFVSFVRLNRNAVVGDVHFQRTGTQKNYVFKYLVIVAW